MPRPEFTDLLRLLPTATRPARTRGAPLRIVHLLPTLGWGGAERLACTMHRFSIAQGFDSRIEAPSLPGIAEAIASETGEAIAEPRPGEESLRTWALATRARLRRNPPDVIHAQLPFPDRLAMALLASRGAPAVVTFQLLPEQGRPWPPDLVLNQRCDRVAAVVGRMWHRAAYVAVSAADRDALEPWLPRDRIDVIPNAPPMPRANPPAFAPLAWPDSGARLLSVGRLHRQKGFDRVLTALATSSLRSLSWHWCIIGEGPERANLERAIRDAGLESRITLAGDRPADAAFSQADLVLVGSRWEGMPLVPMEAAGAGVLALVSPIAPHREILAAVPASILPEDESAWSEVIAALVSDPARRAALARAQRDALPADPRGAMWTSYRRLYERCAGL